MKGTFSHIAGLVSAVKNRKLNEPGKIARFEYGEAASYNPVTNTYTLPGEPDSSLDQDEFLRLFFLAIHEGKLESEISEWDVCDPRWKDKPLYRMAVNALVDARIDRYGTRHYPGYDVAAAVMYEKERANFLEMNPPVSFWNFMVVLKHHYFNTSFDQIEKVKSLNDQWPVIFEKCQHILDDFDDDDIDDEDKCVQLATDLYTFFTEEDEEEDEPTDRPDEGPTGEDSEDDEGEPGGKSDSDEPDGDTSEGDKPADNKGEDSDTDTDQGTAGGTGANDNAVDINNSFIRDDSSQRYDESHIRTGSNENKTDGLYYSPVFARRPHVLSPAASTIRLADFTRFPWNQEKHTPESYRDLVKKGKSRGRYDS